MLDQNAAPRPKLQEGRWSEGPQENGNDRTAKLIDPVWRISPDSPAVEAEQNGDGTDMAVAAREIGHGNGC